MAARQARAPVGPGQRPAAAARPASCPGPRRASRAPVAARRLSCEPTTTPRTAYSRAICRHVADNPVAVRLGCGVPDGPRPLHQPVGLPGWAHRDWQARAGLHQPAPARSRAAVEQRSGECLYSGEWKQQDQDGRVACYEPRLGFKLANMAKRRRREAIFRDRRPWQMTLLWGLKVCIHLYKTHQKILNLIYLYILIFAFEPHNIIF